jgi:hypothetical protein
MKKQLDMMYDALQSMLVIKEFDEEQKKLLIEGKRYRQAAKAAQEQEEEMMKGALEEGIEMEE